MHNKVGDFEVLFHKYFRLLCVVAMRHVHDTQVAEDIVQEFFISYWQRREEIKLSTNFQSYASRAVKYSAIDHVRKKGVDDNHARSLVSEEIYDPQEETELSDLKYSKYIRILEMISGLPEARRKILMMHAVERLSYAEIARRQNVSINTVRTQLSRAYAALRMHALVLFLMLLYYFL